MSSLTIGVEATPSGRHGLALLVLALTLLLWGGALAVALAAAALPDEAAGTVAAIFPPAASERDMLEAVLEAGGRLARDTRFGNVWIVYGDEAGFAGRLREGGAWGVFRPAAFEMLAFPGCVPGLPVSVTP